MIVYYNINTNQFILQQFIYKKKLFNYMVSKRVFSGTKFCVYTSRKDIDQIIDYYGMLHIFS